MVGDAASRLKAVFACCARDCAAWLPSVLHNIEKIASLYDKAAFIFIENDSKDRTKEILKGWCSRQTNASFVTLDGLSSLQPVRTMRLATARRNYITALRAGYDDYSHLIVLDCDEVNSAEVDIGSVRRAVAFLESDQSYAGVFSNQHGAYYDLWALRHRERCPNDVWEEVLDCVTNYRVSDQEAFNRTFLKRIFSLPLDSEPLEVDSAFGGFGIYKVGSVLRNRQDFTGFKKKQVLLDTGLTEVGWQVCEHVAFNSGFREQHERLFVLPYLVNMTAKNVSFPPSYFRTLLFDLAGMRQQMPLNRNALCPCGSGKRFRHCHGALKVKHRNR